jgi:hypothetical protein
MIVLVLWGLSSVVMLYLFQKAIRRERDFIQQDLWPVIVICSIPIFNVVCYLVLLTELDGHRVVLKKYEESD